MHRFLFATLALSASALLPACSQAALTELVVTVDTDYAVPGEIDRIEVLVTGPMGDERASGDPADTADLPLTLGVRATTGSPAVTVTATGTLDGTIVSRTVVRTSFVAGERRVLALWLLRGCAGTDPCAMRCTESGRCEATDVDPATLPAYSGTVPPHRTSDAGTSGDAGMDDAGLGDDAGTSDAGTSDAGASDAGASDAGTNDAGASDAGTSDAGPRDAGPDAGRDAGGFCTGPGRACDDGDSCTGDVCSDGRCLHTSLINGTPCNDGNACTTGDECSLGRCQGTGALACGCACDPMIGCTSGGPCS